MAVLGLAAARQLIAQRLALALSLLAFAVAGCATRPEGLLAPAKGIAEGNSVDMLAVTTRAPSGDPSTLFSGERGDGPLFTNVVISIPARREVGTVQWPARSPGNPATDFVVASVRPIEAMDVQAWFRRQGGRSRHVFVFIHGFNTPFDRAVFRFAQIAHDTDASAVPVLFSWPSRGRLLDYNRDRENATYSRGDLARLLEIAAASPSVGEVTILAHSMGSWLAVEALRQIALSTGRVPGKIRNVVLASPDLDTGVFRRQLEDIGPKRPTITLFVARTDRALGVSRMLAGGLPRLGAIDLTREAYQAELAGVPGLTILDLSALRGGDRINHDLYAQSPKAVKLIADRLAQGQIVTDGDASVATSAGDTIGAAAGAVVAAPILLFEGVASAVPRRRP
jgi:esterase/lipase superfamily enzyme